MFDAIKGSYPMEELLLPNVDINFNISTLRGSLPPLRNFSCSLNLKKKKKNKKEEYIRACNDSIIM